MTRYVAFLGGINVGGHRVSMERLRDEFGALGYSDVSTFIASGNVIFSTMAKPSLLEGRIESHLGKALGYAVPAFVRPVPSILEIVRRKPFDIAAGDSHYVGLLRAAPTALAKKATEALSNHRDTFVVHGTELHWRVHGKLLDSTIKSGVLAKAILQPQTSRNITSLTKLAAQLEG